MFCVVTLFGNPHNVFIQTATTTKDNTLDPINIENILFITTTHNHRTTSYDVHERNFNLRNNWNFKLRNTQSLSHTKRPCLFQLSWNCTERDNTEKVFFK